MFDAPFSCLVETEIHKIQAKTQTQKHIYRIGRINFVDKINRINTKAKTQFTG
jgi:hypothetical protein